MPSFYKILSYVLIVFALVSGFALQAFCADPKATVLEQDQELFKKRLWLEVDLPAKSTEAILHFRVWFEGSPDKVFKVLTNTNSFNELLKNLIVSQTLDLKGVAGVELDEVATAEQAQAYAKKISTPSDTNRKPNQKWRDYALYVVNYPWPISDRWFVYEIQIDETQAGQGQYRYDYRMINGNMKRISGSWTLKPVPNQSNLMEFSGTYYFDPGFDVPSMILKPGVRNQFENDIKAYRQEIAKP